MRNGQGDQFAVGQPIRISDTNGAYEQFIVLKLQQNSDNTTTVTVDSIGQSLNDNAWASNPLRCGAGYKIINCRIGSTRSRGILAKGDDGLIQGNIIDHCQMSAISIGPELSWHEAGYVNSVSITNNFIKSCGGCGYGEAIFVHGDGAIGNSNISIDDNRLVGNYCGDIQISWANNVAFTGNSVIGNSQPAASLGKPNLAEIDNSLNVTFADNSATNTKSYQSPLIQIGNNVTRLTENNNSGITPESGSL